MLTPRAEAGEMTALGRRRVAAEMPRAAIAVRWIIAGLGLATLVALFVANPPAPMGLRYLILFVAAVVLAETFFLVRVSPGSYFSIAPAFLFVYFALAGAAGAAVAAAAAQLIIWMLKRLRDSAWQTPHYAFFNAGQQILALVFAGVIVQVVYDVSALTGPITSAPVATIAAFGALYLLGVSVLTTLAVYSLAGFAEVRGNLWPTTTLWTAISVAVCVPFAVVNRLLAPDLGGYIRATLFTFVVLAGISFVAKLNVNLRYGNMELQALNTIGRLTTATLELPEIFAIVARESRRVLFWDGFFIALGGKESERIELVFFSEEGREIARRWINRGAGLTGKAISSGEIVHYEQTQDKRSLAHDDSFRGSRRPRSLAIAPMKFGDQVIGAICVQSYQTEAYGRPQWDLLQTMAAQTAIAVRNAQLFESEKRAKNERDEFLSLVTHEIKNPLTSIRGYAALAEESVKLADGDSTAEAIRVIQGESAKILRLTEDLLDASRMTAGRFSVRLEPIDLGDIVRQVARKYEATTTHRFETNLPVTFPLVEGDPIRLSQVIENLVSNAVKYSPAQTTVSILLRADSGRAYLSIHDEGAGIPPERLPMIFERFYRVEEEGSTVKGTGLGLFISREIARMHGGDITVDSAQGKGSTFTVQLPLKA